MKLWKPLGALLPLLLLGTAAQAQRIDPFACPGAAQDRFERHTLDQVRRHVETLIAAKPSDALTLCIIAELMKRLGDYRAPDYYEAALQADPSEPGYELFYADYLRNFRGPRRPLFPTAEEHYFEGLEKAAATPGSAQIAQSRLERGLISLYQNDGLPVLHRTPNEDTRPRPLLFFSSVFQAGRSSAGFEGLDDVRDFTSEALFSESSQRLNRPLTRTELADIVRQTSVFRSFNRLRVRYRAAPVLDLHYSHLNLDEGQITNFFEPNAFNDVQVDSYGAALEKPFGTRYFDFFLRGGYARQVRSGLIEFLPGRREEVDQFESRLTVSRFFGPDKANADLVYVRQNIHPDVNPTFERNRDIYGASLTYQFFRPGVFQQRFETRGIDVFGGFLRDRERFGNADIVRRDLFAGVSFRNLKAWDLTYQSTWFSSDVSTDPSQSNSQYRTNVTLLYRLRDEEKHPGLSDARVQPAFLHLVFPFRYDNATEGPDEFENLRVGVELAAKLFTTGKRGASIFLSGGYTFQRFFNVDQDLNLFRLSIGMGFENR